MLSVTRRNSSTCRGRAPVTGQPEVGNVPFVMVVHRVTPEIRAPFRPVERQSANLNRLIVQVMKPWVRVGVRPPEAVHVLLGRVVVFVPLPGTKMTGEMSSSRRMNVEHPPLPAAGSDVARQDEQVAGPVRIELIDRLRQVPLQTRASSQDAGPMRPGFSWVHLHRLCHGEPRARRDERVTPRIADHPCAPHPVIKRGVGVPRHPEPGVNHPDQGLIVVDEIRIETVALMPFPIKRTQRGRKVRDDHVHLTCQFGDAGTDLPVFHHVTIRVPTQRHPEILDHRAVIEMVRVAPEIRAPLGTVKAQALNFYRVIVEIVKTGVPLGVIAPEGVHFPLWGIVVLVIARHVQMTGEILSSRRMNGRPWSRLPSTMSPARMSRSRSLSGENWPTGIRQVPFPQSQNGDLMQSVFSCPRSFTAVPAAALFPDLNGSNWRRSKRPSESEA